MPLRGPRPHARAQSTVGNLAPETSMESALRETLALPTFLARVVAVASVASNVCGISLEGDFSRFRISSMSAATVEIDWLKRDPNRSGSASQVLDRLRILDFDGNRTVAWGAGEARQMASIRRYLRDDLAMNAAQVAITAYWRNHA